jgi:uncharacterized protein (DUF362 family)
MIKINRRSFLTLSIKGLVILKLAPSNLFAANVKSVETNGIASKVVQLEGADCVKLISKSFDTFGGLKKFINKGDVVTIKPNMSFAKEPIYAANTNPEVVAEMVKLCFENGAKKVYVVDNTLTDSRMAYQLSGIAKAAATNGADVVFPLKRFQEEVNLKGEFLKKWEVFRFFLESNKVINMPVAKHHGSAYLSCAMKNWLGAVGGARSRFHQSLHQSIYDLASFFKPTINVVDCTRVLLRNGPSGGSLKDVQVMNKILISTDQVAVDFVAANLLKFDINKIKYLAVGHRNKLGTMFKNDIEIVKING